MTLMTKSDNSFFGAKTAHNFASHVERLCVHAWYFCFHLKMQHVMINLSEFIPVVCSGRPWLLKLMTESSGRSNGSMLPRGGDSYYESVRHFCFHMHQGASGERNLVGKICILSGSLGEIQQFWSKYVGELGENVIFGFPVRATRSHKIN